MKEIIVLSGKGGAGKTTVTSSLSVFLDKKDAIVDADVDASDMHILLQPKIIKEKDFYSGKEPEVDRNKCVLCRLCVKKCPYNALSVKNNKISLEPISCEGCGMCFAVCPEKAIEMKEKRVGKKFISDTIIGIKMAHAELFPGEENSGKLVSSVRQDGRIIVDEQKGEILLIDGPPGIGCSAISAVTNSDLVILTTESTTSGFHDIKRCLELVKHFKIKTCAVMNKYGLNKKLDNEIEDFFTKEKIPIVGKINYSTQVIDAHKKRKLLSTYSDYYEEIFKDIYNKTKFYL
jgi:MinD superfamily P-loop ATPase